MKTKHLGLAMALTAIVFSGCYFDDIFDCERGRGGTVTETLDISAFDRIRLDIPARVYLTQGDYFEVVVEGRRNVIDEIERDVHDGEWDIEFDRCMREIGDLDIYITIPSIARVIVQSSGEVYGENTIVASQMDLLMRGSGLIDLALDVDYLDARIQGSGDIYLEGSVHSQNVEINASGDYGAFNLVSDDADVRINGSGDAQVYVNEYLKVKIRASGDVYYKGDPELDISITGSGDVFNAN
ncbi:MAG: head GIN domain-containing protein [Saprospiraceae bacterium]|nr:head GIN domain-containing protein [Saprospiraceae bacterium]